MVQSNMQERKAILYLYSSVDGLAIEPTSDLAAQLTKESATEKHYQELLQSIDTMIIGKRTFNLMEANLDGFPDPGISYYIKSHFASPRTPNYHYFEGSPGFIIERLKKEAGKNILIQAKPETLRPLFTSGFLDEMIITIIPKLLAKGVRIFKDGRSDQDLKLLEYRELKPGYIQLHYEFPRSG